MIKVDLSNKKVGDKVWSCLYGEEEIEAIRDGDMYCIDTFKDDYTIDGKAYSSNDHPACFESYEQFKQYWKEYEDSLKYVTADEAIEAFRDNDKIKRKNWGDEFFISLGDSNAVGPAFFAYLLTDTSGEKCWEILGEN